MTEMCDPNSGIVDRATTVTGIFHPWGGHVPNDPGDGGPLIDAIYYDSGNQDPPATTPPYLHWPPIAFYPGDDQDPEGEIHGESHP